MAYMKKFTFVVALALIISGCCNKDASTGSASNCSNENTKEETTMNTTMQDLLTRRSIRSYTDEVPPREVIEEICKAGTYAPTGMNRQAPIIIAVTNREVRDEMSRLNAAVMGADNDPFYGAPVVLVVLADSTAAMTWKEDGSLVMEVFETEEGKAILAGLGIDTTKYVGIGNCILGYVKGDYPEARPRKENYVYWIE